MLKNQFKSALRSMFRSKLQTTINLSGFITCLISLVFISLHIREESGYDLHHSKVDRIYRITVDSNNPTNRSKDVTTGFMVAESLREYPEVEHVTRVWNDYSRPMSVVQDQQKFIEDRVYFTDPNFFDVFDVEMISGNAAEALSQKNGLILSEETAVKYFGDEDPMGKVFNIVSNESSGDYIVTGVARRFPEKSHFNFDFLASTESIDMWWKKSYATAVVVAFVVLEEGTNITSFEEKIQTLVPSRIAKQLERWYKLPYDEFVEAGYWHILKLQPLKEIYLHSDYRFEMEPVGSIAELRIIALIGLFILILGIINYINLATASASLRLREIAIRTVLGTDRRTLMLGLLAESVFISCLGVVLSLLLAMLLLPYFNSFAGHNLMTSDLLGHENLMVFFSGSLTFGLVAGLYPALLLSNVNPARALKGIHDSEGKGLIRNTLVVVQFSVSVFLIIATIVVGEQLRFIQNKKLGFDQENIIAVDRSMADIDKLELFSEIIKSEPGVRSSAITTMIGAYVQISTPFNLIRNDPETLQRLSIMKADDGYLATMDIELAAGRWFSNDFKADSMAIILNKQAVEAFGLEDPVGTEIYGWLKSPHTIIGVVEDFHTESLHSEIKPLGILSTDLPWPVPFISYVLVKTTSESDYQDLLSALKSKWDLVISDRPFKFRFLDDHLDSLYEKEQRTAGLFKIFSGVAIFIACLGLYGLVTFIVNRRLKEIGIRKVLGASLVNLYRLLSMSLAKPILVALVLSIPVSIYLMDGWLQQFAYHIKMSLIVPFQVTLVLVILVLMTISYTVVKAALINPADILRDE